MRELTLEEIDNVSGGNPVAIAAAVVAGVVVVGGIALGYVSISQPNPNQIQCTTAGGNYSVTIGISNGSVGITSTCTGATGSGGGAAGAGGDGGGGGSAAMGDDQGAVKPPSDK